MSSSDTDAGGGGGGGGGWSSGSPDRCCPPSPGSSLTELKLYQAFIFSVPIVFTFVLLFSFYMFYLRRRRADWVSLRMRTPLPIDDGRGADVPRTEAGLTKELREMLPVIVYKESFSVNDSQCSVCLGDYESEDRLQQVPVCGHTFHMGCIDHWLATHTTCPLCRTSLLAPTNRSIEVQAEAGRGSSVQEVLQASEETETRQSQQENGFLNEQTGFQPLVLETEQHPRVA